MGNVLLIDESHFNDSLNDYGCYEVSADVIGMDVGFYLCRGRVVLDRLFSIGVTAKNNMHYVTKSAKSSLKPTKLSKMGFYVEKNGKRRRVKKLSYNWKLVHEM